MKLKYGLRMPSFALGPDKTASLDEMGKYLRRAEDLGFECALSIDHLLVTPPAYACTWLEPLALINALAGVTRTIKLGTLVMVLPLRNPVQLAKLWATFDFLSGGRSILGIGVGWHEEEFALAQVPYKERGGRMNEGIEILKKLWTENNVTYKGKYFSFENLTIDPKPTQRPTPPIWLGGGTQPSERFYGQTVKNIDPVLNRIAKYADVWCPHASGTPEMVSGDWEKIHDFAKQHGRDPSKIGCVYVNYTYVLKPGEKPEAATPHFSVYSGMDLDYWKTYYLLGEAEHIADKVHKRLDALNGRVSDVIFNPMNWSIEQLELIANEVIPRIEAKFKAAKVA